MRNIGKTEAQIQSIKQALEKEQSIGIIGKDESERYINRLKELGVEAISEPYLNDTQEQIGFIIKNKI